MLPVRDARSAIIEAVRSRDVVIVVGATGSGKSTQVPQFLLEEGLVSKELGRRCCVTQPRRVAVLSVSRRVAEERKCDLGDEIGYAMRFDTCAGDRTAVKFATDGYLLREATSSSSSSSSSLKTGESQSLLRQYGVLVLDEAHERSIETDVLLGLAKRADASKLKVIVMSATLEAKKFEAFFSSTKTVETVHVPGRTHPVDTFYCVQPQDDFVDAAVTAVKQLLRDPSADGDVLVFMPGQDDILAFKASFSSDDTKKMPLLDEREDHDHGDGNKRNEKRRRQREADSEDSDDSDDSVVVLPLYAALPRDEQRKVFATTPPTKTSAKKKRKVVVATTIAETSVTIPGIRHVVDPGLVKARRFDHRTGLESLEVVPTSQAQATQRAGRAGREGPGRCYRLYPEPEVAKMRPHAAPDIERADLASIVLQLKRLGVEKPQDFELPSPPPRRAVLRALELLYALSALDDRGALTAKGHQLAALPLGPLFGNLVVLAREEQKYLDVADAVIAVVGLLSAGADDNKQQRGYDDAAFRDRSSDLVSDLNAYAAYRAVPKGERRHWASLRGLSATTLDAADQAHSQIALVDDLHRKAAGIAKPKTLRADFDKDLLLDCLVAGLAPVHAAVRDRQRRCYTTLRGHHDVFIHPSSVLRGRNPPVDAFVFATCVTTNKRYVRGLAVFRLDRLPDLVPHLFRAVTT